MPPSPHRSWVEISREQIGENYENIRQTVGPAIEVMPVVKADAYRHGAIEVSRIVVERGARWLAVSNVEEGIALREAGIDVRILVMADFLPPGREAMLQYRLTPVIHSLQDLRELDHLAASQTEPVLYHLKLDTGMYRLGTRSEAGEIAEAIRASRNTQLEGAMTHFASVADFTIEQTEEQAKRFFEVLNDAGMKPVLVHLSSTGGVAYNRCHSWGNLVRPGHAIYGYVSPARGSAPSNALRVKPALTWKAAILTVKDVPEGALIGYGGMRRALRPMRIAVLAVGYADGLPHRLSNRGRVIVRGRYADILGAVSMDLTTIDVTGCARVEVGDAVTILGEEGEARIDAQDIARVAGTISYSVLCGISSRVKRVYL